MNAHQTGWSGNLLACLLVVVTSSGASGQTITTVAGRGLDDEGPATRAGLAFPPGEERRSTGVAVPSSLW